jgi:hypothetical protein
MLNYAEYFFIINSFRCSSFRQLNLFHVGFHADKDEVGLRTLVNNALSIFVQYHEASRRTAAEQKDSLWEAFIKFMIKYPFILKQRNWDPAALGDLIPIDDNQ